MTDPISDLLARLKNGYMAHLDAIEAPYSRAKEALLKLLSTYGYVGEITKKTEGKKMILSITLIYSHGRPAITEIKRVSKPGLRKYIRVRDLGSLRQGLGHIILSTPLGLKNHIEARKSRVGGEIICTIW